MSVHHAHDTPALGVLFCIFQLLCSIWMMPQIGSKGLEIKVDNPEAYNFRPKDMLRDICTTISQFCSQKAFHKALATSGYYQSDLLPKASATMRRLQLLPPAGLAAMDQLCGCVLACVLCYFPVDCCP